MGKIWSLEIAKEVSSSVGSPPTDGRRKRKQRKMCFSRLTGKEVSSGFVADKWVVKQATCSSFKVDPTSPRVHCMYVCMYSWVWAFLLDSRAQILLLFLLFGFVSSLLRLPVKQ